MTTGPAIKVPAIHGERAKAVQTAGNKNSVFEVLSVEVPCLEYGERDSWPR